MDAAAPSKLPATRLQVANPLTPVASPLPRVSVSSHSFPLQHFNASTVQRCLPPHQAPVVARNGVSPSPTLHHAESARTRNRPAPGSLCASDDLQTRPTSEFGADRDDHRNEFHKDRKPRVPEIPRCARSV